MQGRETVQSTYGDIALWDVSAVTDMSRLFESLENFNENIVAWNVSAVTDMKHMFHMANRYCSVTKAIVGMTLRYRGGYPGGKTK